MAARRFMISARSIRDGYATFDGELYNHMVRVLRLGPGTEIELVDEKGIIHCCVIDQVDREWVAVRVCAVHENTEEAHGTPQITICQALPKGDKTDLILQKGTELGAYDFCLFAGKRSVAKIREDQRDSRLERWSRIVAEASRQCKRRTVPQVSWQPDAARAAGQSGHELKLILWEGEDERNLKKTLDGAGAPASVIVAIGPEGGFDPAEVNDFTQRGFIPVSLGSRILRTETAGLAILAVMQYKWDGL